MGEHAKRYVRYASLYSRTTGPDTVGAFDMYSRWSYSVCSVTTRGVFLLNLVGRVHDVDVHLRGVLASSQMRSRMARVSGVLIWTGSLHSLCADALSASNHARQRTCA